MNYRVDLSDEAIKTLSRLDHPEATDFYHGLIGLFDGTRLIRLQAQLRNRAVNVGDPKYDFSPQVELVLGDFKPRGYHAPQRFTRRYLGTVEDGFVFDLA